MRRLSEVMGAEVTGIDVARPLAPLLRRQLEDALDAHKLLCFRDQLLTTDSLVAFARTWGIAEEVSIASNADENGRPNGILPDATAMRRRDGGRRPREAATATLLYGLEVPSHGGDTIFELVTRPALVYRHRWRRGDLLMWDDRCTLHADTPYDATRELRTTYRTFVARRSHSLDVASAS